MTTTLFLVQFASTLFMTGLIWFVQIVHYPLFAEVGSDRLSRYEGLHAQRTSWVVFPPMLAELLTTLAMLYPPLRPNFVSLLAALILNALIGVIWLTTAIGHVPLHTRLGKPEPGAHLLTLLVRLNWLRTLAWTLRAALLLSALAGVLHHA